MEQISASSLKRGGRKYDEVMDKAYSLVELNKGQRTFSPTKPDSKPKIRRTPRRTTVSRVSLENGHITCPRDLLEVILPRINDRSNRLTA